MNQTREQALIDMGACRNIAARYLRLLVRLDLEPKMDVSTIVLALVHAHDTQPMRLNNLLASDDRDFAHDVSGILRNINVQTGRLENCFSPRCGLREHPELAIAV